MSYQTSYDSNGGKPFKPNKDRGFWSSSSDFFYACVCNSFRMDVAFGVAAVPFITHGGIFMFLALVMNVILFTYPIVFMQSFLGQFSSSGFISAFRVAPLFKGVGYIALAMNVCSLTFYAIYTAVPILFLIYSLSPTLPWSCEAWLLRNKSYDDSHCSDYNETEELDSYYHLMQIPSVEYFSEQFQTAFSFSLYGCVILVWIAVSLTLCNTTEKIGQILRYSSLSLIALLSIVSLRMMLLPGSMTNIHKHIQYQTEFDFKMCFFMAPMLTLATFGPGWGSILSMASYNNFKTDINKYSWLICFSQLGVLVLLGLLCMFTESHLTSIRPNMVVPTYDQQWTSFLSIPSSLATMEFPHLWTWMFLAVLITGTFNLMITQMFSILTALFDEFEILRLYKVEVTLGLSGVLALISAYFCTENGIYFTEIVAELSISTQAICNLMLLIIVVWVYGRERFQRDVEFMTSQALQTWKINIVRFVTPIFLGVTLLIGFILLMFSSYRYGVPQSINIGVYITLITWLALPVYCVFQLLQTNGTLGMRFKRCVKPTDWYPTDAEQRQQYEETIDNPETFQPLTTIVL
ncbi:sodium- and chloride-dependent neutral and basic amino acid transporter B(0+)-like [Eupeodes corollae]|uniref:sodium- and chloride-dependent neutral and basic amino acid transporter B(0+)-like n=1 Tax=Eupeodes corollae TaxID=290404 RepID=UPI00248FAFCF|nr:sodium- and chloride-dependent neutral and basic amino acid transporter B(0+)-like [Eupeodes corollae]